MDLNEWKTLASQALVGFVYGFAGAMATVQQVDQAALYGVVIAAIKGAAHAIVKALEPRYVARGKQFEKKKHWTDKADRLL